MYFSCKACKTRFAHAIASGMTFNWRLSGRAICINHCTFMKQQCVIRSVFLIGWRSSNQW